ncbi:MAG: hypothetical protein PHV63_03035 [Candidatus Daviesbacteria bacterium]|nr:hypothetical protein [Candidatus Daviesbacteria bacterium]
MQTNPENSKDRPLEKSDEAKIADALDEFLSGGGSLRDLFPQKDPLLVYERLSVNTDRRVVVIEQFVTQLGHFGVWNNTLKEAAKYIPLGLESYRSNTSLRLRNQNASETDIALVDGLTLQDVALYANQQYREFSDRLSTMSAGSPEHREVLEKASFWSKIDERINRAANLSL